MSKSVERRGIDQVLQGFQAGIIAADSSMFSITCGKDLKFSYRGDNEEDAINELNANLMAVKQAGSMAIYCLRFHHTTDKDGFITFNTPYASSFNFRVNEIPGYGYEGEGGIVPFKSTPNAVVLERMEQLEKKLDQMLEDGVISGEKEEYPEDRYMKLLENPLVQSVVSGIINKVLPLNPVPAKNISLAGTGEVDPNDQMQKAFNATQILIGIDPQIGDLLMKLATKAQANPDWFNTIKAFL